MTGLKQEGGPFTCLLVSFLCRYQDKSKTLISWTECISKTGACRSMGDNGKIWKMVCRNRRWIIFTRNWECL